MTTEANKIITSTDDLNEDAEKEKRTKLQNRALHKYFTMLAEALNDAGLDMKAVLKPEVDIPWNCSMVKEHLWRPIQNVYLQKQSTTEQCTDEVSQVYKILDRHIAEKFGVSVPFPSKLNQGVDAYELYREAQQ